LVSIRQEKDKQQDRSGVNTSAPRLGAAEPWLVLFCYAAWKGVEQLRPGAMHWDWETLVPPH